MRRVTVVLAVLFAVFSFTSIAIAQEAEDAAGEEAAVSDEGLTMEELRDSLVEAFEARDIEAMLEHLHPSIVVTWQNADVTRGHNEVRAYFEKMLTGPNSIVVDAKGDPEIDSRKDYGAHIISFGHMNDELTLRGEKEPLKFDSRFSSLVVRHEGEAKLAGLHLSLNAFENPVMEYALAEVKKYTLFGGIGVLLLGFVLGYLVRGGK